MSPATEPLLRMPDGSYASHDGRFYFNRIGRNNWRVIDAIHQKSVEFSASTLADTKTWMRRRRRKVRS
jgi:hypothetical protein